MMITRICDEDGAVYTVEGDTLCLDGHRPAPITEIQPLYVGGLVDAYLDLGLNRPIRVVSRTIVHMEVAAR